MHNVQTEWGIGLASELTAPTFALWHGLEAVNLPHLIYAGGKRAVKELGRIMNPGAPGRINSDQNRIWNWDHHRDHILYRLSYMFSTQLAEDLYRRWMAFKSDPNQYADGSYASISPSIAEIIEGKLY
jgi:hypothetical protein